jgi:hypothetical protein
LHNLRFACALVGVSVLCASLTAAVIALRSPPSDASRRATGIRPRQAHVHVVSPAARLTAARTVTRSRRPSARPRARAGTDVVHLLAARHIGATPSLYERTTSIRVLRAQGCHAARVGTNGVVVLDFGKLAYRPRRGGYGTITFADRFASNRSITWAMKSYARGYSRCLRRSAHAHIVLARGTSNYDQDVPSTYIAGKLWAGATVALANYLRRHHFEHVTAAAGDDVEPAWDRGFRRTYDFFRGYRRHDHGFLIYNYGSLDGGVGVIWKLRQAYYVAGGMQEARAVPEIYNRAMAQEWAELARLSVHRYGKPIKLAGVMTQHWTSCSGCGYTAHRARHVLAHELAQARVAHVLPARSLEAATNIAAPR